MAGCRWCDTKVKSLLCIDRTKFYEKVLHLHWAEGQVSALRFIMVTHLKKMLAVNELTERKYRKRMSAVLTLAQHRIFASTPYVALAWERNNRGKWVRIASHGQIFQTRYDIELQRPNWCVRDKVLSHWLRIFRTKIYCKVTNFRPVPIFVLLTCNWFVRTNFRTFDGLKTKINFHPVLNFALFQKCENTKLSTVRKFVTLQYRERERGGGGIGSTICNDVHTFGSSSARYIQYCMFHSIFHTLGWFHTLWSNLTHFAKFLHISFVIVWLLWQP